MPDALWQSGPTQLSNSAATVFSTTGETVTIRDIQVCNESGAAATFTLSVGTDGSGKRLYKAFSIPTAGFHSAQRQIIIPPATSVQAYSDTASALTLYLSGVSTT